MDNGRKQVIEHYSAQRRTDKYGMRDPRLKFGLEDALPTTLQQQDNHISETQCRGTRETS